jgi:hypothetical protein
MKKKVPVDLDRLKKSVASILEFEPKNKVIRLEPFQYTPVFVITNPAGFLISCLIRLRSQSPLLRKRAEEMLFDFSTAKRLTLASHDH